ncbi:Monothiol glutaredoxin-4 [Cucumispora dikerogammari]|nr:Monothiol glutaredoxin-4 [Cucumispora dikerogammari]
MKDSTHNSKDGSISNTINNQKHKPMNGTIEEIKKSGDTLQNEICLKNRSNTKTTDSGNLVEVDMKIDKEISLKKGAKTDKSNIDETNVKKVNKIIENSFDKLSKINNILAYNEKTLSFVKLSSYCTDPETVIVDLSINKKIEQNFLEKFEVVKLPCLISYGLKIYDNENLEDNLKEREKRELQFLTDRVKGLVSKHNIFIFIKGTVEKPKCKFTRALLSLLDELNFQSGLDYDSFNILTDDVLREKMKIINEWPTFPQIFIKGKFIGGINSLIALKEENLINEILK